MLDRFLCVLATAGEEEYEPVFMILLWYPGKCRRNIFIFSVLATRYPGSQ